MPASGSNWVSAPSLGAVVMGDQALSFPLQELVEARADVSAHRRAPSAAGGAGRRHRHCVLAGLDGDGVPRRAPELWYAAGAILAITLGYGATYLRADALPSASGLAGHGIGIAGFILMLMTATLYSVRKLRTTARWGSMAAWLRFHMVTGLVGPYMVLLHTAMRFRGLAGLAMLLTAVVVVSGLIGRYLYTAVPRDVEDGVSSGGVARGRGRAGLPGDGNGAPREGRGPAPSAGASATSTAGAPSSPGAGGRSRSGTPCTSRSPGRSSPPPSSTSWQRSTTRPCSARRSW